MTSLDAEPEVTAYAADLVLLPGPTQRRGSRAAALLRLSRPRQWIKNLLVAAAPLAAGQWLSASTLARATIAFVTFTGTAAGCYMLNDIRDVTRDRWHPTKRTRPIAAGEVSVRLATAAAVGLLVGSPLVALVALRSPLTALVLVTYAAITTSYSFGLKSVPGLEIAMIAAGFVLRPLAGAAATAIRPSLWFLGVVTAGAAMVAIGKRSAELFIEGSAKGHRTCLRHYNPDALRLARAVTAGLLLACYLGWVATRPSERLAAAALSLAAVAAAVQRFQSCSDAGRAGAPERLFLSDRRLQLASLVWVAAMLWGTTNA